MVNIMSTVLLQKPSKTSKRKDHVVALDDGLIHGEEVI